MIYADTDFFIALVKDDDWLGERAASIAADHEGDIYTSRTTLLELLLISDRFEFDRMEALSYALEIATVPEDESVLFQAADYMEQRKSPALPVRAECSDQSEPRTEQGGRESRKLR